MGDFQSVSTAEEIKEKAEGLCMSIIEGLQ
jgi:hypothetical protein